MRTCALFLMGHSCRDKSTTTAGLDPLGGNRLIPQLSRERRSGRGLIIGLILAGSLLGWGCNFERAAAERELNNGIVAFSSGDSQSALAHMEAALREDPTLSAAAYYIGQIHQMRRGDLEEAARGYRRALDIEPANPRYAYRLGTVLAEQGDHQGAITHFETATREDPEYSRAWFMMGLSQNAAGEFRAAVDSYTKAIETNPRLRMTANDPGGEHYHALADLYIRFRLFDHAAKVYANGVENNPTSPRLHHGHGVALMELERYSEAAQSFEKALERDPRHGSAGFNLGVALHKAGDRDGAIAQLESVKEQSGALNRAQINAVDALLADLRSEDE